jgi:hypothetical protein
MRPALKLRADTPSRLLAGRFSIPRSGSVRRRLIFLLLSTFALFLGSLPFLNFSTPFLESVLVFRHGRLSKFE